jgi:HEAT repeat protein
MSVDNIVIVQKVLENLSHEDADERRQAVLTLGKVRDLQTLSSIIKLLNDPVKAVQEAVVDVLVQIRGREVVTALSHLLKDANLTACNLIVEVLKQIGGDAPDILITELRKTREPFIERAYYEILGAIGSSESFPYLVQGLQSSNVPTAMSAAEALGQLNDSRAIPYLLGGLKESTWIRCAVLDALGKIGDQHVVESLIQIPSQENIAVTFMVIKTLGHLGDERCLGYLLSAFGGDSRLLVPVIEALEELSEKRGDIVYEKVRESKTKWTTILPLLNSHDDAIRRSAIRVSEKLHIKEAIGPLIRLIKSEDDDDLVEWIINALVAIGDQELESIHQILLVTEDIPLTKILLQVLGRIGKENSASLLIQALDHPHEEVRMEAAKALGNIQSFVCVEPLIRRLEDSFGHARRVAASSLGAIGDPKALVPLVEILKDPYIDVRMAASEAIVKIQGVPDEEKIHFVQPLLLEDREEVRVVALQTLFKVAGSNLFDLYTGSLKDPGWKVREVAVQALVSSRNPHVEKILLPLLDDENVQVRLAVVKALAHFSGDQTIQALLSHLEDLDSRVRYEVCKQLKNFNRPDVIQGIIKRLQDSSGMVRLAAIESLGHFKAVEAIESLHQVSKEDDPDLAEEANRALKILSST